MYHIVILGGGFAGVRAALQLGRRIRRARLTRECTVTLISRDDRHSYTPLLYEVATTSKATANLCELYDIASHRIKDLIAGLPIRFIHAEIRGIDLARGSIELTSGEQIPVHTYIIALGVETNYFDIPHLAERAFPLKTIHDGVRLRDAIFNRAMEHPRGEIRIVVGGGGPTGVELAAELRMLCDEMQQELYGCKLSVTLIQGAPTILPRFPGGIIRTARERLIHLGAELCENERITHVHEHEIELKSGSRVPYDLLVWTGGVKGTSMLKTLPVQLDPHNHIVASDTLLCKADATTAITSRVYIVGDAACIIDPRTKEPVPSVARAALSQASIAAANAMEDLLVALKKKQYARYRHYHPMTYPYITPIGGKYAVAQVGPFRITGLLGWLLKGLVELNYLLSIMPARRAVRIWLKGLAVFIRSDRLG